MGRGKKGPGPWGRALEYWLEKRNWSQADLVRAIRKREQGLRKQERDPVPAPSQGKRKRKKKGPSQMQLNTVSRACRGLHTHTSQLERMAEGLGVPYEEVLVSPDYRMVVEQDRQRVEDAVRIAMRLMDDERSASAPAPSLPAPRSDDLVDRISRHDRSTRKKKHAGPKPPPSS